MVQQKSENAEIYGVFRAPTAFYGISYIAENDVVSLLLQPFEKERISCLSGAVYRPR